MKWTRDPQAEALMKRMGVTWTVEQQVPIEEIDLKLSTEKQSRVGRVLDQNVVVTYGIQMSAPGAAWPMVIINRVKRQATFLLGGLHRTYGCDLAGIKTMDCYVCSITNPLHLDLLPRALNCLTSIAPSTKEQRLTHAAFFIEHYSMDVKEASDYFGLKYEWINQHLRQQKVAQKIVDGGVSIEGLPRSILTKMSPIDNVKVLRETAKLLKHHDLGGGTTAEQIVDEVKGNDTEATQLTVLEKWDSSLTKRKQKRSTKAMTTKVRSAFLHKLVSLRRFLEQYNTVSKLQIQPEDGKQVVDNWQVIDRIMGNVLRSGSRRK